MLTLHWALCREPHLRQLIWSQEMPEAGTISAPIVQMRKLRLRYKESFLGSCLTLSLCFSSLMPCVGLRQANSLPEPFRNPSYP